MNNVINIDINDEASMFGVRIDKNKLQGDAIYNETIKPILEEKEKEEMEKKELDLTPSKAAEAEALVMKALKDINEMDKQLNNACSDTEREAIKRNYLLMGKTEEEANTLADNEISGNCEKRNNFRSEFDVSLITPESCRVVQMAFDFLKRK